MRTRKLLCGLVVVSMVLAACGSGEEAEVYTPEELEPALLTAEDLGPGWSEQLREVFTTGSPENPATEPSTWCPDAAAQQQALNEFANNAGVIVELRSEAGEFHSVMEQAWNNTDVEEFIETASTAVATCSGTTWTMDEGEVTFESSAGPEVGDESTSAVVVAVTEGPESDMAWRVRMVVVRLGATAMLIQELEVQPLDSEPLLTDAEWSEIVDTAANKIEQLDGS